jgi:hypothetical protein
VNTVLNITVQKIRIFFDQMNENEILRKGSFHGVSYLSDCHMSV